MNEEKKNNEFVDGIGDVIGGVFDAVGSIDLAPVAEGIGHAIGSMFEALQ